MNDLKKAILISFAGGLACGFSVGMGVGYVIGFEKRSRIDYEYGNGRWTLPPSLTQRESHILLASSAVLTASMVPLLALALQK